MEYEAKFGINGGATCLGGRLPESETRIELINEECPEFALRKALCLAMRFSMDYLSDPITKTTKVKLLELKEKDGKILPQESLYNSMLERILKESGLKREQVDSSDLKLEDNCYFVETTPEDKLLAHFRKQY